MGFDNSELREVLHQRLREGSVGFPMIYAVIGITIFTHYAIMYRVVVLAPFPYTYCHDTRHWMCGPVHYFMLCRSAQGTGSDAGLHDGNRTPGVIANFFSVPSEILLDSRHFQNTSKQAPVHWLWLVGSLPVSGDGGCPGRYIYCISPGMSLASISIGRPVRSFSPSSSARPTATSPRLGDAIGSRWFRNMSWDSRAGERWHPPGSSNGLGAQIPAVQLE